MGYNTSAVILNDALGQIEDDKDIGKKIADGVRKLCYDKPVNVSAGNHCNAIYLVENHHADHMRPILVGGNYGVTVDGVLVSWNEQEMELQLLRQLAAKHGFVVQRRRGR